MYEGRKMTKQELLLESDQLHAKVVSLGFILRRQPHVESDTVFNVYFEGTTHERRAYGEGASWEEAIIRAAKKALTLS
jgi:hypothetical protein